MTKSLSNVIKAYAVRYNNDDKHIIDLNEKAEAIQKKYLMDHPKILQERVFSGESAENESGFVAGLHALPVGIAGESSELTNEQLNKLNEQQLFNYEEEREAKLMQIEEEMQILLNGAKKQAKNILEEAKKQADKEKQILLRQSKEDGYKAGKAQAEKEIELLKTELEHEKEQLHREYEQKLEEIEPEVVSLLIALLKKLTGVVLEEKKEIIIYLVEQALLGLENSNLLIIRVSKEDYDLVFSKKTEIKGKLKEDTVLEVTEDPLLLKSHCLIETESRIIDCSLDVQLNNLIEDLLLLAGSKETLIPTVL